MKKFAVKISSALVGLVLVVAVQRAQAVTVTVTNPLVDLPATSSAQVFVQATSEVGTFGNTVSANSLPFNITTQEQSIAASSGNASGTATANFIPSSTSGLSGDVTLRLQGAVGVGLPNDGTGGAGVGGAEVVAAASVTYYVEITGPNTGIPVVGTISASGYAAIGGGGPTPGILTATSVFTVNNNPLVGSLALAQNTGGTLYAAINTNETYGFFLNTPYTFSLSENISGSLTGGECTGNAGCSVTFGALIDPTISLNVSDPQDYSIFLSPNLTSAVPEPSTWAMMMLGFAGLGFVAYRRKTGAFRFA
jgi:PEP-CTERM motif